MSVRSSAMPRPDTTQETPDEASRLRAIVTRQLEQNRRQRDRIAELEGAATEPLAVVGMAVRLPGGVSDPEAFWRLLTAPDADDVVVPLPADRPGLRAVYDPDRRRSGTSYVDRAGFLDDLASFDPTFWGISTREAESLDPQQRLLLETAWEALEDAGIPVDRASRRSAGVFVGMMSSEYTSRITADGDLSRIDPYFGTGGGHSFAAGRVSYALGLTGPALTVDTACSSSLVALHLAVRSLRSREVDLALVGGANLVLGPELMVSLSQTGALAPDGRSKTFRADADGYGRGEGVGVLALMRLSDAERGGHPVLALVRGSAVNHDGASSGLTVPNGPAQQEVLRAALTDAGVSAAEIGYVETHGTGTALGDPIEVAAIDEVLGTGAAHRNAPVQLGSVKSRIGHLEAAAGLAGLVKTVLVLRHGVVPPATGPDDCLNPLIPWDEMAVRVPSRPTAWTGDGRRIAGVSAFGLSGTNAHAVLEEYTAPPVACVGSPDGPELLVVSARTPAALRLLADRVADRVDRAAPEELGSVAHTLRAGRTHHQHRLAVVGTDAQRLARDLRTVALDVEEAGGQGSATNTVDVLVGDDDAAAIAALQRAVAGRPQLAAVLARILEQGGDPLTGVLAAVGIAARRVDDRPREKTLVSLRIGSGGDETVLLSGGDAAAELLSAIGVVYRAGLPVSFAVLAGPADRLLGGLPGHPFLRRRCWLEEATVAPGPTMPPAGSAPTPVTALRPAPAAADDLEELLLGDLASIFKTSEPLDRTASFQECGGDSFAAMMLTKAVQAQHGVVLDAEEFPTGGTLGALVSALARQIRDAQQSRERAS